LSQAFLFAKAYQPVTLDLGQRLRRLARSLGRRVKINHDLDGGLIADGPQCHQHQQVVDARLQEPPAQAHGAFAGFGFARRGVALTVKLANIPVKFYWDFAYNLDGGKRFSLLGTAGQRATTATLFNGTSLSTGSLVITQRDDTNPVTLPFAGLYSEVVTNSAGTVIGYKNLAQPSNKDKMAWLIGLKIGDNKRARDLSAYVDYRQVGIAAVDPNLASHFNCFAGRS
jgi:hypothetical protein